MVWRIGIVGREHTIHGAEEDRVVGGLADALLVDALQESLRAVVHGAPEAGGKSGKQGACRAIPAVPEVVGEFVETVQSGRNLGIDFELVAGAGHDGILSRGC